MCLVYCSVMMHRWHSTVAYCMIWQWSLSAHGLYPVEEMSIDAIQLNDHKTVSRKAFGKTSECTLSKQR